MKLIEIAALLKGEIIGESGVEISGVSGIGEAKEGDITFVSGQRYLREISRCRASCILVKDPIAGLDIPQLKVSNPYLAYAKLLELFYLEAAEPIGISDSAVVSAKAKIGKDVSIFPFAFIADDVTIGDGVIIHPYVFIGNGCIIGANCVVHPHVTLRENVRIGDRVIIHSGSVIGSDGFGYVFEEGRHHKIPQVGGVIIEDDVEIGSNVSIDRATTGDTRIGRGTKIDNLVQIGHNVSIGANSILVAQVGIGGSSKIGDYVTLAGQVGVADHVTIESGTMVGAQSGIIGKVTKGTYAGTLAIPHKDWLKAQAIFAKLPELKKRLKELEKKVAELEGRKSE